MPKRVPKKIREFTYEGETFALRRATVLEMMKITELTTKYQRTVKQEKVDLMKQGLSEKEATDDAQGDPNILFEAERYIARWLTLDPASGAPLFNADAEMDAVDSDFILAAWRCYTTVELVKSEKAGEVPLATEATTISSSEETSSASQSTSESTHSDT